MYKYFIIPILILIVSATSATEVKQEYSVDIVMKNIVSKSIDKIIELKKQNKNKTLTIANIKQLIRDNFIPFIAVEISTKNSLKKYWKQLTNKQKELAQQHVINLLINDYAAILLSYNDFKDIIVTADPNVKKLRNKAIIKLNFKIKNNNPTIIAVKAIKKEKWRIYDVIIFGVSLVKNYRTQFNSYIKRNGLDDFIAKYLGG